MGIGKINSLTDYLIRFFALFDSSPSPKTKFSILLASTTSKRNRTLEVRHMDHRSRLRCAGQAGNFFLRKNLKQGRLWCEKSLSNGSLLCSSSLSQKENATLTKTAEDSYDLNVDTILGDGNVRSVVRRGLSTTA